MAEFVYFVTTPNMETSRKLASIVVGEKIAACVNIIPSIKSIYWWKDKIEESDENLLVIKTTGINSSKLKETIKKHHPYDTPECVGFPIQDGLEKYLEWLRASVK